MSSLICKFDKRLQRFRINYLDLLFEHKDVEIDTFINLFYFSYNSFKLRQNNIIDFSISFLLKLSFGKQ